MAIVFKEQPWASEVNPHSFTFDSSYVKAANGVTIENVLDAVGKLRQNLFTVDRRECFFAIKGCKF